MDASDFLRLSFGLEAEGPAFLQVLVLERIDRARNMARYYVLSIEPTLFEEFALVRRWGRIGGAGQARIDLHPSPPFAQVELEKWLSRKRRRGYVLRPDCERRTSGDGDGAGRSSQPARR